MHYWNNIRFSRQKLYWSIKYLITMNIRTYIHHKVLVLYTHIYLFINRPFHKRQWNWLILVSPRMRLNVWCPRMRLNVWWVLACEAECNVWCTRVRLHLLSRVWSWMYGARVWGCIYCSHVWNWMHAARVWGWMYGARVWGCTEQYSLSQRSRKSFSAGWAMGVHGLSLLGAP